MYKIEKIENDEKDRIPQPPVCQCDLIPRVNSSSLLIGASGSGKTTLLNRLLTDKRFFKGYFDDTVIVSPTAASDKAQKDLGASVVVTDMKEAPGVLDRLLERQKDLVTEKGFVKAPKICLVFDDVVGFTRFMNCPAFTTCFIANRHHNITTFICSQSYKSIPRRCRLQASNIFFFRSSKSESERIIQEYCPPGYSKPEMEQILDHATGGDHSFLHINMKKAFVERYSKNLDECLRLCKPCYLK